MALSHRLDQTSNYGFADGICELLPKCWLLRTLDFAATRQDYAALRVALETAWSNGLRVAAKPRVR